MAERPAPGARREKLVFLDTETTGLRVSPFESPSTADVIIEAHVSTWELDAKAERLKPASQATHWLTPRAWGTVDDETAVALAINGCVTRYAEIDFDGRPDVHRHDKRGMVDALAAALADAVVAGINPGFDLRMLVAMQAQIAATDIPARAKLPGEPWYHTPLDVRAVAAGKTIRYETDSPNSLGVNPFSTSAWVDQIDRWRSGERELHTAAGDVALAEDILLDAFGSSRKDGLPADLIRPTPTPERPALTDAAAAPDPIE